MFSQSIRRKIIGIALGLVVLMVATSVLSMLMASRVGHLLDELTNKYVPAYRDLARANVRSLERALALRQMVIAKMQTPPDDAAFCRAPADLSDQGCRGCAGSRRGAQAHRLDH
jgi:hypothetical protein